MTEIKLPDFLDLRFAQELGALALLDAALVVAEQTLRLEHAELDTVLRAVDLQRPAEVVLAAVLTDRFREVRSLLGAYTDAVRHSDAVRHHDIPF